MLGLTFQELHWCRLPPVPRDVNLEGKGRFDDITPPSGCALLGFQHACRILFWRTWRHEGRRRTVRKILFSLIVGDRISLGVHF